MSRRAARDAAGGAAAPGETADAAGAAMGGDRAVTLTSHFVLILWTVIVVVPLLWTLMSSFKTTTEIFASPLRLPAHWNFTTTSRCGPRRASASYFRNTIVVVGSALVLVMTLGSMCAYVLARFRFRGSRAIYYMMLACLTFPIFLAIVPLFKLMDNFHLLNTRPGLVVVYVAFAMPFTVFFMYPFFRRLPTEMAEAAAVDGAGEWRTFFQVMLPMAKPGLASVAIFNFLGLWNQFLLPVALNTNQENYVLAQGLEPVRVECRLLGRLRRALRRRRHHGGAGAGAVHHLPATARRVGHPGHDEVAVGAAAA